MASPAADALPLAMDSAPVVSSALRGNSHVRVGPLVISEVRKEPVVSSALGGNSHVQVGPLVISEVRNEKMFAAHDRPSVAARKHSQPR